RRSRLVPVGNGEAVEGDLTVCERRRARGGWGPVDRARGATRQRTGTAARRAPARVASSDRAQIARAHRGAGRGRAAAAPTRTRARAPPRRLHLQRVTRAADAARADPA